MEFTHFNEDGNAVMVDVSNKMETQREAIAQGTIRMKEECYKKVMAGQLHKGDVLGVARIAGIMGAKRTSELIPLCHILNITNVEIDYEFCEQTFSITAYCKVKTTGKTGVEMEALTGVQITLLTIYDMCKAVDKTMEMSSIYLCRKSGGKSGTFVRDMEEIE